MGCGTVNSVTLPIVDPSPKWKEESVISDFLNKSSESTLLLLVTDSSFIQITETDTFSSPISSPNTECAFALLPFSKLLVAGGVSKETNTDSATCLLITDGTFSEFPQLLYPTRRLRLVVLDDQIYAVGGVREIYDKEISLSYSNNFCRYQSEKWTELEDMPIGVEYPSCHCFNYKIYATGGCAVNDLDLEVLNKIQVFDTKTETWTILKITLPIAVYGHITVPVNATSFLLVGGLDPNAQNSSVTLLVKQDTVEEIAAIPAGISTFFPYSHVCSGDILYAINDERQIMSLNQTQRFWNIVSYTKQK
jgi:hypothetical protein